MPNLVNDLDMSGPGAESMEPPIVTFSDLHLKQSSLGRDIGSTSCSNTSILCRTGIYYVVIVFFVVFFVVTAK